VSKFILNSLWKKFNFKIGLEGFAGQKKNQKKKKCAATVLGLKYF